jgi:hypothetical protein
VNIWPQDLISEVSADDLKRGRVCGRAFALEHGSTKPRLVQPEDIVETTVRHALDLLYDTDVDQRSWKSLHQTLLKIWPIHSRRTSFVDEYEETGWRLQASTLLNNAWCSVDHTVAPVLRHAQTRAVLTPSVTLVAHIDRVDLDSHGDLSVLLYITRGGPRADERLMGEDPTVLVAATTVRETLGAPVSSVSFFDLHSGTVARWEPRDLDLHAERIRFQLAAEVAELFGDHAPVPGALCGTCRHLPTCPAILDRLQQPC